ncbi:secondary thiamine-phosphate synthase enzyme YjbQ [Dyadobacter tibetensis]|uniref:secondary thiamine-phosphate synthase enzyme YjbQ n=1 Tax=Dyadobacter tibetensis TaxID=1211851 RepID=UPI000472F7E7|nr:secondary thiamine-phosphate synthase enzyme YjbQ [Dyadobacter tibetensis]
MKIIQKSLTLRARSRGFHSITDDIRRLLGNPLPIEVGICQIFIQHTSASLALNEDADPTVRIDFETYFNKYVPENDPDYRHDYEGSDDMPAHLKAAILGASVMIPVKDGALALGTWQGIYLCEHRNYGGNRNILVTLMGQ